VLTGVGQLLASGAAAGAAVLLAHRFGRTAETDGFLAAYGVYMVLGLAAQAFRLVVVPQLTRAAAEGRLAGETRAWAAAFLTLAVPVTVAAILLRQPLGDALTGDATAAHEAARALPFLIPAAFVQLLAALLASSLAAIDEYTVAAVAWGIGNPVGLIVFAALSGTHGLVALAWGVLIGGCVTCSVLLAELVRHRALVGGPRAPLALRVRLFELTRGAAVPLAVQGMYVISLWLAGGLGVGAQSSLSYGYVFAATLVAATASALSLISSAPLTRRGIDAESAARHVVHAAWLSLVGIAAATGVFALVGGRLASGALGSSYSGSVGSELGRLVVYLAPWMVVAVAFTVVFPLLFVVEKPSVLIPLAVVALAFHIPVSLGLRAWLGLYGLALALAASTLLVLVVLLAAVSPRMLELASLGLGRVALGLAALAAASFWIVSLVVSGVAAAVVGTVLYAAVLLAVRPRGLREAWAYVRVLH
jgi:peptidoglycan biosynthesis protein MviN/MurJ (putative lipid II flippase)